MTLGCRVIGPGRSTTSVAELTRLLPGAPPTGTRATGFYQASKMIVRCGDRIVGVAAYRLTDGRLDVSEFGVDPRGSCAAQEIERLLLQALEAACLAGGGCRIVLAEVGAALIPWLETFGYGAEGERPGRNAYAKTLA